MERDRQSLAFFGGRVSQMLKRQSQEQREQMRVHVARMKEARAGAAPDAGARADAGAGTAAGVDAKAKTGTAVGADAETKTGAGAKAPAEEMEEQRI